MARLGPVLEREDSGSKPERVGISASATGTWTTESF